MINDEYESSSEKELNTEPFNLTRCLNALAWLLEKSPSSCAAICLVNAKLLIADNDLHQGSRLATISDAFQHRILNHLVKFINRRNERTYKIHQVSFLKKILLEKAKTLFKGGAITSLSEKELEELIKAHIDNPDAIHTVIMSAAKIKHSVEKIAALVEHWKKFNRRLLRIEEFLEQNPESPLSAALHTLSDDMQRLRYLRLATTDGTANCKDRNWLLASNIPGCGFILSNEKGVHAELKIIDYLLATRLLTDSSNDITFTLGISKKCCFDCGNIIDIINRFYKDNFNNETLFPIFKHRIKFNNWLNNLPIFLLTPTEKKPINKGLLIAERYKAWGYKSGPAAEPELFCSNDRLDDAQEEKKSFEDIMLYRDYRLLAYIRKLFRQSPEAPKRNGAHSPMSQSSPEKSAPKLHLNPDTKMGLEHYPTTLLLQEIELRILQQGGEPTALAALSQLKNQLTAPANDEANSRSNSLNISSSNQQPVNLLFKNTEVVARQVQGYFAEELITFDVFRTLGDGSYGYYSLPVPYDRAGVVELLMRHKHKRYIRDMVATEIYETFVTADLCASLLEKYSEFKQFQVDQAAYDRNQATLLTEILDRIDPARELISDRQFDSVIHFLENISDPRDHESNCLKEMLAFKQEYAVKLNEFMFFCQSPPVFEDFIRSQVAEHGKLSFSKGGFSFQKDYSLLDAILQLTQPPIRLYIWESITSDDDARVAIAYIAGPKDGAVTHMYHSPGRDSHFALMAKTIKPISKATMQYNSSQRLLVKRNLFATQPPIHGSVDTLLPATAENSKKPKFG